MDNKTPMKYINTLKLLLYLKTFLYRYNKCVINGNDHAFSHCTNILKIILIPCTIFYVNVNIAW